MTALVWVLIADYDKAPSYVMRVFGTNPAEQDIERALAELRPDALPGYLRWTVQVMEVFE